MLMTWLLHSNFWMNFPGLRGNCFLFRPQNKIKLKIFMRNFAPPSSSRWRRSSRKASLAGRRLTRDWVRSLLHHLLLLLHPVGHHHSTSASGLRRPPSHPAGRCPKARGRGVEGGQAAQEEGGPLQVERLGAWSRSGWEVDLEVEELFERLGQASCTHWAGPEAGRGWNPGAGF